MRKLGFAALLFIATQAFAQNEFILPPEYAGRYGSGTRLAPSYVDARVLAAGVSETHTIPATSRWVIFSANCDFHAKRGASAAVPAADVTDGSASELNPSAWFIEGQTQITVISSVACIVTMSFYK